MPHLPDVTTIKNIRLRQLVFSLSRERVWTMKHVVAIDRVLSDAVESVYSTKTQKRFCEEILIISRFRRELAEELSHR